MDSGLKKSRWFLLRRLMPWRSLIRIAVILTGMAGTWAMAAAVSQQGDVPFAVHHSQSLVAQETLSKPPLYLPEGPRMPWYFELRVFDTAQPHQFTSYTAIAIDPYHVVAIVPVNVQISPDRIQLWRQESSGVRVEISSSSLETYLLDAGILGFPQGERLASNLNLQVFGLNEPLSLTSYPTFNWENDNWGTWSNGVDAQVGYNYVPQGQPDRLRPRGRVAGQLRGWFSNNTLRGIEITGVRFDAVRSIPLDEFDHIRLFDPVFNSAGDIIAFVYRVYVQGRRVLQVIPLTRNSELYYIFVAIESDAWLDRVIPSGSGLSVSASRGSACGPFSHSARKNAPLKAQAAPCVADGDVLKYKKITESWDKAKSTLMADDGEDKSKIKGTVARDELGNDPNAVWEFTAQATEKGKLLQPLPKEGNDGIEVVMTTKDHTIPRGDRLLISKQGAGLGSLAVTFEPSQATPGKEAELEGYWLYCKGDNMAWLSAKKYYVSVLKSSDPFRAIPLSDFPGANWLDCTDLVQINGKVPGTTTGTTEGYPLTDASGHLLSNTYTSFYIGPEPKPEPQPPLEPDNNAALVPILSYLLGG